MKVVVHLHTILQLKTSDGLVSRVELDIQQGSNLGDLLKNLDLSIDEDSTLLVINGRWAELSQELKIGDEIHLIPALSGGDTRNY
jgi:molybdopterin converting factor small subunit